MMLPGQRRAPSPTAAKRESCRAIPGGRSRSAVWDDLPRRRSPALEGAAGAAAAPPRKTSDRHHDERLRRHSHGRPGWPPRAPRATPASRAEGDDRRLGSDGWWSTCGLRQCHAQRAPSAPRALRCPQKPAMRRDACDAAAESPIRSATVIARKRAAEATESRMAVMRARPADEPGERPAAAARRGRFRP